MRRLDAGERLLEQDLRQRGKGLRQPVQGGEGLDVIGGVIDKGIQCLVHKQPPFPGSREQKNPDPHGGSGRIVSAVPPELLPYEKQSLKTNFCLTHSHGAPTKESACVRIDRFRSDCGW